jgi:DNA-binding CsgD family transcriptional regulator
MVDHILEIINKRSMPGLVIIDTDYRLLYTNREALEIIFGHAELRTRSEGEGPRTIPDEIATLCDRLKMRAPAVTSPDDNVLGCAMLDATTGGPCSLRVCFMENSAKGGKTEHIVVLMERIVEKHEVDFKKAQEDYHLSKREVEVLQCVCRGLTNKEIAETKFISEYTVKDHIKKIMRCMGVNSRSKLLTLLR